jgi:hypothetical protein
MSNSINSQSLARLFDKVDKAKSKIQEIDREILKETARRLIEYSAFGNPFTWHSTKGKWPKGYTPGHFIMNWQLGIDTLPAGEIQGTSISRIQAESVALERLSHMGRWTAGHTYNFVNNAPYAAGLESGLGSHQVPPKGIVGRVALEFPQIVKYAIQKVG